MVKLFNVVLMLLSLNAFANNTWYLLDSKGGVKTYIDRFSISGTHATREFEYLEEYAKPRKVPASTLTYYAVQGHEIVNCRDWTYKIVSVAYYGKHHQLLHAISVPRKRVPFVLVPDRSQAESDVAFTCLHLSLDPGLKPVAKQLFDFGSTD